MARPGTAAAPESPRAEFRRAPASPSQTQRERPRTCGASPRVILVSRARTRQLQQTSASPRCQSVHLSMRHAMTLVAIQPLVALLAGILILLIPRLLNYIVALYLIIIGLVGLFPAIFH